MRCASTGSTGTPKSRCFGFGRCLAHFAVDPDLVYVTTHLRGGQDPVPALQQGRNLRRGQSAVVEGFRHGLPLGADMGRDSVLDLVQHFIQIVEEEDDKGNKTGERSLLFPRYHQLDAVRRLVADALERGVGQLLPGPAQRRERQEQHHRLAGAPVFRAPRCPRRAGLRFHHRHHRPARAGPAVAADGAAVRADAGRGGEHRHHLPPVEAGAGGRQDHHRHHAAKVPGHPERDGGTEGQAVRRHHRRSPFVPVGRKHQEPEGSAVGDHAGGSRESRTAARRTTWKTGSLRR